MILTNDLINIGFAVITQFTNVVHVSDEAVPKRLEDLREVFVGTPHSPIDLCLVQRSGTMYTIRDGSVYMFETPGSFMKLQDFTLVSRFVGKENLSSNDVMKLATGTIEKLARTTNPIANVRPVVKAGRRIQGKEIPFYEITWPKPYYRPGFGYFAGIEIDARNGQVTHLELHDPSFFDYDLAQQTSNRVCIAEPPKATSSTSPTSVVSQQRIFPLPTTNEVERAIGGWTWLCEALAMGPDAGATWETINWDRSCLYTNHAVVSPNDRLCRVEFKNGAWGLSLGGIPVSYYRGDACFSGWRWRQRTGEEWLPFRGIINKHWEELARDLESTLAKKFAIPKETLERYAPHVEFGPPDQFGTENLKRVFVEWVDSSDHYTLGYAAEFDVENGELKGIGFREPKIIEALGNARSKLR